MHGQQIEAVFENGVFRPLQPIQLPERQQVTLLLPASGDSDEDVDDVVDYRPIPLNHRQTIRVRYRQVGELPPVPYGIESALEDE